MLASYGVKLLEKVHFLSLPPENYLKLVVWDVAGLSCLLSSLSAVPSHSASVSVTSFKRTSTIQTHYNEDKGRYCADHSPTSYQKCGQGLMYVRLVALPLSCLHNLYFWKSAAFFLGALCS